MNEYLNVIRNNYANFTGRARRREYWMFTLINVLVVIALEIILGLSGVFSSNGDSLSPLAYVGILLMGVYVLFIFVPTLAINVRRLHDAGFSGWLMALNFIGLGVVTLVMHCLDSKPENNKWGQNPKGTTAPARAF